MVGGGAKRVLLLERDEELGRLDRAVRATAGGGGSLVITGPPGSGKTALLRVAMRGAEEAGMAVFSARGSELEQGLGFAAARQLFERPLVTAEADGAAPPRLGAAAPGWAALGLREGPPAGEAEAVHGLWWLLVELAERGPVLLALDDAQWLDRPTLRWLAYAAHRLADVPVLLVATVRDTGSVLAPELGALLADPSTDHLSPAPLSEAAIGRLLELRLDAAPEAAFLAACRRRTGGNAFVVGELATALAAAGVSPTAAEAERVADFLPATVSRWLSARIERLGPDPRALARALAVAGDGAALPLLAGVSGLSPDAASNAADALVAADLLAPGRPWRFAHDLVRDAVAAGLSPAALALAHRRCAEALAASGGDPEEIAVHWLAAEPAGDPDVVEGLRDGARQALGRGDPAAAVGYLRRALAEGRAPAGLLRELGRAELFARDPACSGHLGEALEAEDDPRLRAEIGIELSGALVLADRWRESLDLNRRLRADLADDDGLAFGLDAMAFGVAPFVAPGPPGSVAEDEAMVDRLRARAELDDPAARPLRLQLACVAAMRGAPVAEVVALVERGYAGGRVFEVASSDSLAFVTGVMALLFVERQEAAREIAEGVLADARRHGLVFGYVSGAAQRGLVALVTGELRAAEADLRDAFALAREHELGVSLPFIAAFLARTLLERGSPAEAAEVLALVPAPGWDGLLTSYSTFFEARGAVQAAAGDRKGAIADLRAAGEAQTAMRSVNPLACAWRSRLALVLGAGPEATALAAEELQLAEALGAPGAVGAAARALALVGEPGDREDLLRRAVDLLDGSPARLEHTRARVDLGSVLLRRGASAEAREHLVAGLDLAGAAGADVLAERARAEAVAAGARPRRPRSSGAGALTPAQLRVARLAAQGMTNRQIAQSLFITLGTVKDHLGSAYRKLGIASREELAARLEPAG
jgi:DNA-binding CsgD family transcriptional regulator